jgi:hypothetical protein
MGDTMDAADGGGEPDWMAELEGLDEQAMVGRFVEGVIIKVLTQSYQHEVCRGQGWGLRGWASRSARIFR